MNSFKNLLRIIIFLSFFSLIIFSIYFFKTNIYWEFYQLHWDVAIPTFLILIINSLYFVIISKLKNEYNIRNLVLPTFVSFILLVFQSAVINIVFLNILFIFISFGFGLFFSKINKSINSILLNYLFGIIMFQLLLFLLSFFNLLLSSLVLTLFISISIFGYILNLQILRKNINIILKKSFNLLEVISLLSIFAVLFYSFILICLPQTQSDGLVYRLTFLKEVAEIGTIPFHYYLWDWVTPQAMKLALLPGYFFSGEYGAATQIFIFFIIMTIVIFKIFIHFINKTDLSLIFTLIVISTPIVWVESFSIFFEIPILTFIFSGIISLIYYEYNNNKYFLYLSALLFGFCITIKINTLLFIALLGLTYLLFKFLDKKSIEWSEYKHYIISFFIFLIISLPWFIWTFSQTGNPFFPFFSNIFSSTFIESSNVLLPEYRALFYYPLNFYNVIFLPLNLFIDGFKFHSLDGATNIWPVLLFFTLPIIIFIKPLKIPKLLLSVLISSVFTIIITYFVADNTLILRYWLHAYVLLIMLSLILLENKLNIFLDKRWFSNVLKLIIIVWSMLYLSVAGIRINYELNLGHKLFWDTKELEKKINSLTYGIDTFINQNIKKNEQVTVTGQFYQIHKLNSHTFFMSSDDGLFGNISNFDKTINFIKTENIRYWIIDTKEKSPFIKKFIENNYLNKNKLVYGDKHFLVYDLKSTHKKKYIEYNINKNSNLNLKSKVPSGAYWYFNDIILDTDKLISTVILTIKKFDNKKNLISEYSESREIDKTWNKITLSVQVEKNVSELEIFIKPWRNEIDGNINIETGKIRFYMK